MRSVGRVEVGGIEVIERALRRRSRQGQHGIGGLLDLLVHRAPDFLQEILGGQLLVHQEGCEELQAVLLFLLGSLLFRPVEALVVGQGVGVGPGHLGLHQRRAGALATVLHSPAQGGQGSQGVVAVTFLVVEMGPAFHQPTDGASRRLHLHRDRDGVAVVLDEVEHREAQVAGGVQGLPELSLGGRSLA
jgi:hypothetical protein